MAKNKLRIILVDDVDKLKNLIPRTEVIQGNPDDLVEFNWKDEENLDLPSNSHRFWLYVGLPQKFSPSIKAILNENEISISPIVRLEREYRYGIERVRETVYVIVSDLVDRGGCAFARRISMRLSARPSNRHGCRTF